MAHAFAITLRCRPGAADTFIRVLGEITAECQAEVGSIVWQAHQSLEDGDVFLVYETYVDEAAYAEHLATPAFQRVERELFPLLADREVRAYAAIGG
jgi:quinol monooxygenase YgiN